MGNSVQKLTHSEPFPSADGIPTFDPHFGFSGQRKKREMPVSEEVVEAAKVTLEKRDYCVKYLIDLYTCQRKNFPTISKCKAEEHKYDDCEYQELVLRMKEYERERRLLAREQRKQRAATVAA